jgi:hypothetical protein
VAAVTVIGNVMDSIATHVSVFVKKTVELFKVVVLQEQSIQEIYHMCLTTTGVTTTLMKLIQDLQ